MSLSMNSGGNTMVNSIGNSIGGVVGIVSNGGGMIVTQNGGGPIGNGNGNIISGNNHNNNNNGNNMGNSTPATPTQNCQSIRYCWEADKVKTLIRLRAELSPLFTGKRNASKYAWAVVERELSVPLPISKIIKKWNNLLQEYKE
ncbi:hypothetical protein pipiens_011905 [Culex pipiens pipiens]|uniref:MADF domain-containing protein n=1 Tax=Culex pipiens pipiens TaxID=38569 RepID=A0ABD1D4H8_CULPP